MKARSTGSTNCGFITLEILIAFTILILCIGAVIIVTFGNQSGAINAEIDQEALSKAQAVLEKARADAKFDFNLINPSTNLEVIQKDLFTKEVTSHNLSTTLTTLLTNPEAVDGGDTCSSVLTGDWKNPEMTSYEFGAELLSPSDSVNIFPIKDIDVNNHKLYAVIDNANSKTLPTFFKFDITDSTMPPIFIDSMDNNPGVESGFNAFTIVGHYAYLANAHGANYDTCVVSLSCSQLQVVNTDTMKVVGKLKIPSALGAGGQATGQSIFYKNGIVYLGLRKTTAGTEFNIIDVGGGGSGGSPTNPIYLGGINIGNWVNSIYIKDGYAYIASPNNTELEIVDVSNSFSPSITGQFDAPAGGGNNGNGKSLGLVGNVLYLGRTLLTGNEFYILDKTDPATELPVLAELDIRNSSNNNTSVNGIIIRDFLIFLLTNSDLQILKLDTSYSLSHYRASLPTPGGTGTSIDCEGNYIYFSSVPSNSKGFITITTAK